MTRSDYQDEAEYLKSMVIHFYNLNDFETSCIYRTKLARLEKEFYKQRSRPEIRATLIYSFG